MGSQTSDYRLIQRSLLSNEPEPSFTASYEGG
jgi:hypothetical protein